MNSNWLIAASLLCGLLIWLRYIDLKRAVGRTLAKQMMPLESLQLGLLSFVLVVLYASDQTQTTLWLVAAMALPIWAIFEVIRAVLPDQAAVKVILEPDPSDRNAVRLGIVQALVGALALFDFFSRNQSDVHRLALCALFLAAAASSFARRLKPAILTETGYKHFGHTLRWTDIEAYQWLGQSNTLDILVYQRKTPWRFASISYLRVPTVNQPKVNEFLSRYVVATSTLSIVFD